MKKNLLIAAVLAAFTASSYAQGVIALNGASGYIKYTTDGSNLTSVLHGTPGTAGTYGTVNVAVYSASAGTILPTLGSNPAGLIPNFGSNWYLMSSAPITTFAPPTLNGAFPATTLTLNTQAGAAFATEQLEVVAWTGSFASFTAALSAGTGLVGWAGASILNPGGSSYTLQFTTGDGVTSTPVVTTGSGAWGGLVLAPVPEPGTIALGGLGAAALLLFRRRK